MMMMVAHSGTVVLPTCWPTPPCRRNVVAKGCVNVVQMVRGQRKGQDGAKALACRGLLDSSSAPDPAWTATPSLTPSPNTIPLSHPHSFSTMALPRRTPLLLLALVVALVLALAQAFLISPSTIRRPTLMTAQRKPQQQSRSKASAGLDRKSAVQQGALLISAFLFATGVAPIPALAKDKPTAASFEECVSKLLLSKKVLEPVQKYIKIGQFDPARTNIKYVTNQFRLKKAMERIVLLAFEKDVPQSKLDDAAEVCSKTSRGV